MFGGDQSGRPWLIAGCCARGLDWIAKVKENYKVKNILFSEVKNILFEIKLGVFNNLTKLLSLNAPCKFWTFFKKFIQAVFAN